MEPTNSLSQRESAIRRFHERVDRATLDAPAGKEWVRKALHRGGAPRCPVRLRRLSLEVILRYGDDLADLFCAYPEDTIFAAPYDIFIGYQPPGAPHRINMIQALTEEAPWTDEWGTVWRHAAGGTGASTLSNPITDWSQLDDYLANRMPRADAPGRLDAVRPALEMHGRTRYFCGMTHMVLFERLHCLRGMDNTFADFYLHPGEVERMLDALTEYYIGILRAWGRLENVDGVFMTDDWGTQTSMMIDPAMWRRFFAKRYRRIFAEAHAHGLDVHFHSCGNVTSIIGDLIDAGADVIDPLQPEAMDLKTIAREFGGRVAFCGGLSDQRIAACTPAQVKEEVRRAVDTLGKAFKNACIVAPSNVLTPEIPLENIAALFEACHAQ